MTASTNLASSVWQTRVQIYELDSLGHVNNANYYPYLHEATLAAWPASADWTLQRLTMEFVAPALYGATLDVNAWMEDATAADQLALGYAIVRVGDGQLLVRARLEWAAAVQDAVAPAALAPVESVDRSFLLKPARPTSQLPDSRRFHWRHRVRSYEVGGSGTVGATEVLRWTEEGRARASEEIGWSRERMEEADFMAVVTRHEVGFHRLPRAGQEVELISRVCEMRKVRGTWRHVVMCDGELAATALVTGGFLNRDGQPYPPPPALIDGLVGQG